MSHDMSEDSQRSLNEALGTSITSPEPEPFSAPPPPPPVMSGGPPTTPPPPPPPGVVPPVTKYVRGSSSGSVGSAGSSPTPKKKPTPADVGAAGPNLFALAAGGGGVKSVGKVSDRIRNLQGGMAHVFGGAVESTPPVTTTPAISITTAPKEPDPAQQTSSDSLAATSPHASSHDTAKDGDSDWEVVHHDEVKREFGDVKKRPSASGGLSYEDVRKRESRGLSYEDVFADHSASVLGDGGAPVASPLSTAPDQPLYRVRAAFKFEAVKPDDLPLDVGDVAAVEKEEGEWLFGFRVETEGVKGWFPRNFVDVVQDEDSTTTTTTTTATTTTTPALFAPAQTRFLSSATVLWDYTAVNPDELSITAGEKVGVIGKPQSQWWSVENSVGGVGLVPATYLQEEDLQQQQQKDVASPVKTGLNKGMSKSVTFSSSPALSAGVHEVSSDEEAVSVVSSASTAGSGKGKRRHTVGDSGRPSLAAGGLPARTTSLEDGRSSVSVASYMGGPMGAVGFAAPTAWINKVDPALLEQIPHEERKRQEAIFELIQTEQSYVRDLQLIVEVFYAPLTQLLTPPDIRTLFSNIEEVLFVNSLILSDFETAQIEQSFVMGGIGRLFIRHADKLSCYQPYCANFGTALKLLQKRRREDARLAEFLKTQQNQNPKCRSLDLSSFLLEPMQRITRYTLLLRQILHHTPVGHPDHDDILAALEIAEATADRVNVAAREQESRDKIEEVSAVLDLEITGEDHKLDLFAPTRFLGPRMFVHEGPLQKSKSGRKLHGYLFNDLLLLAQAKSKSAQGAGGKMYWLYRKPLPVNEIVVRETPRLGAAAGAKDKDASADDMSFQIVHGQDAITLRASSVAAKRKWMNALDEQIRVAFETEKTARQGSLSRSPAGRRISGNFDTIGTLQVLVCEAKGLVPIEKSKLDIYATVQLNRQKYSTRTAGVTPNPSTIPIAKWNQALMFSVMSLDETLKIAVYNYDKYSQDDYLGQAEIQLDFLEYYRGKETERITLELKDVKCGVVVVQLVYRSAN
ncbi:Intersectin 1 (SH3 domain protein) [Borealophlyctis nickersoniae]|nr:Intersectin 1 (SH3 domain protein) [Borealophlyctis nickersoniae]